MSPQTLKPSTQSDTPSQFATRIHSRATKALVQDSEAGWSVTSPVLNALVLLRHLRPGQTDTAEWCHEILAARARHDLHVMGYAGEWVDLLLLLHNFLDASGRAYRGGRWVNRVGHVPALRITA